MLRVMLQKIWHKKWMVLCLLLGSMLLIATVVGFPLYRNAAFDRMLVDEFQNYLAENGEWPAKNRFITISKKDRDGKTINRMEELLDGIYTQLGVKEKETIYHYSLAKQSTHSLMMREDAEKMVLRLGYLSGLPEHAKIQYGEMYSEDGISKEGSFEVVVSQATMVSANLLVGETLEFESWKDQEGNPIRMKIVGVFEEADKEDFYWQMKPDEMDGQCLMNEALFRENFLGENAENYSLTCTYFSLFEYEDLKASQVDKLLSETVWLKEESPYRSTMERMPYREILESFAKKKDRIEATLFILQVPVLILLCAFLFMISGQMYDMERNEISVMKSRGGSSGQMLRLYFYQSIFITLIGAALGLPLGTVFCRILGSAQNFLEFNVRRDLTIAFTKDVWLYAMAVVAVSILIMTLPALKHSRLTIVKLKQQNALKKKSWWEKLFLDIVCLVIALYGFYNYSRNKETLIQSVMQGEALDPLLYISSSLFIVGMGLLFLRLQPLLVKFVYLLGKRFWGPASYASFMENIKNGRKQQFIMLFMILTVSLGMFHATVARTILQNAKDNAEYLNPTDIIVKEVWMTNASAVAASGRGEEEIEYYEPDYTKYATLPDAKAYTKVVYENKLKLSNEYKVNHCVLMGIHTKQFGENTQMPDGLLEKHYYEYLNKLAAEPLGVLLSKSFQNTYDLKVGDRFTYYLAEKQFTAVVLDFFEYWPGYAPTSTTLKPDGSVEVTKNYMVVSNIATLQNRCGVIPYEVWITLKEGASSDSVYQWIGDKDVRLVKFSDKQAELTRVVEDPLLQGTNGVLTMGFIVTIILCGVGYLIYWIMSIRSREMLFGVLRASGMHKGELFHMLMNEQIFSGVLSILAGVGIGALASKMFVPMLQTAYAAANQVLPMKLITNSQDMVRLYGVVVAVMALCLVILILLVFKLNITKALKLGEE